MIYPKGYGFGQVIGHWSETDEIYANMLLPCNIIWVLGMSKVSIIYTLKSIIYIDKLIYLGYNGII